MQLSSTASFACAWRERGWKEPAPVSLRFNFPPLFTAALWVFLACHRLLMISTFIWLLFFILLLFLMTKWPFICLLTDLYDYNLGRLSDRNTRRLQNADENFPADCIKHWGNSWFACAHLHGCLTFHFQCLCFGCWGGVKAGGGGFLNLTFPHQSGSLLVLWLNF